MWQAHGALWGMEFKYQDAPRMTRSIRTVMKDLPLRHLWIVYPGSEGYRLDDAVSVVPVTESRRSLRLVRTPEAPFLARDTPQRCSRSCISYPTDYENRVRDVRINRDACR